MEKGGRRSPEVLGRDRRSLPAQRTGCRNPQEVCRHHAQGRCALSLRLIARASAHLPGSVARRGPHFLRAICDRSLYPAATLGFLVTCQDLLTDSKEPLSFFPT